MPYFSIIIPVYNKQDFIIKTLKSVFNQTFTDYEIIIVNDGSKDNSESKILTFRDTRIRYFVKKNEGVAIARNFGIEKANANYICFLDADDYWYPEFLETMYTFSLKFTKEKVFSCAIEIQTKKRLLIPEYSISQTDEFALIDFFEASQKECALWTSSTVIHKSVLDNIGWFDSKVKHGEDTDLWIRIGLQYKIIFIWRVLACYIYDVNGISRNNSYFFDKYTFDKYVSKEKTNQSLKKYMDLNRFSAIIKCKLIGDWNTLNEIQKEIDIKNLNFKKKILLTLHPILLKSLIQFKNILANLGFGNSVFR